MRSWPPWLELATNAVADVFADALRAELANLGFQLADGGLRVSAELSRFYNDFKAGMMSGNAVAEAALNVTVRLANGRSIFSKGVSAEGSHSGFVALNGANAKIALDNSLRNVVSKLVDDPDFLNSLTQADDAPDTAAPSAAPARAPLSDVDELPATRRIWRRPPILSSASSRGWPSSRPRRSRWSWTPASQGPEVAR